jgi:hypothetical protein
LRYLCPKLAAKNGSGGGSNNGNKDSANVAKSDPEKEISLVMVDRYTKLSACGWCGKIVQGVKKVKASAAFSKNTKFGIRVPRTVKEALEIDRITGTTFWRDAIDKEMAVV